MQITEGLVQDLWCAGLHHFGATTKNKNDSTFMYLISQFLDGCGITDKNDFMNRCTTTIGNEIFIPFDIGNDTTGWSLWNQVATFSHEVVHVRQWRDDTAGFMLKYLCSKNARAEYEAEAYGADLELSHWLQDPLDPNELAGRLASYGLASEYIAFAAAYLATYDDILQQGGSVSPTAKWAIAWLEAKGVTP